MSHAREKGPSARFAASERSPRGIARSVASHVLRDSGASHGFAHCPTCAICGGKDATTRTDWANDDGSVRSVPACAGCADETPIAPDWGASRTSEPIHNRFKTHCKRGHAFDAVNTIHRDGRRICRACRDEANRVNGPKRYIRKAA